MPEPRRRPLVSRQLIRMLSQMAESERVEFELQVSDVKIRIKPANEDAPLDRKTEIVL